jgi:type I restriction enzyme S subunit
MSNWETLPLGNVLSFQRGFDITKAEQRDGPYWVISSSGPKSTNEQFKVEGPGVIIGRKGSLGTVFYSGANYWPHDTTLWVKDFHGNNPKFAYYFLQTMGLERLDAGSSNPSLNRNHIHTISVLWPSPPIQRRIAGILSAYDDLIENSQRRIKILEEMARRLYREWFVHFRFPGHEDCRLVDSPLGEIPEGWEVKALASLMTAHIGGGWGKDVLDESHTEPAWVIRGTDIPGARSCRVADVPHRFHGVSNLRSRRLTAGDIVFEVSGGSKGQPVGRTLFMTKQILSAFNGDVICASFCKRVSPDADAYGSELLYLSFLEDYESGEIEKFQVQSTGISNFKWMEFISETQRVVPPEQLRSRFQAQVSSLFDQLSVLGLQIQNLCSTRDLLLPRLLSGQIDVEALPEPVLSEP